MIAIRCMTQRYRAAGDRAGERAHRLAAADALSPDLDAYLPRLLDAFLDKAADHGSPTLKVPGLIDGSAGVALTLHTIVTGTSVGWETCLLII
jgi:hypothetical protein